MPEQAQGAERKPGTLQQLSKQRFSRLLPFAVLGVLVFVVIGLVISATQSSEGGVPRLQVDREMIDFGDQHLGTVVRATFKITSVGDGTLTLSVPRTPTVVEGC